MSVKHIRQKFLSTPSARRATFTSATEGTYVSKFLSTPSARRATAPKKNIQCHGQISIHALREEGDAQIVENFLSTIRFLSTPSARRATSTRWQQSWQRWNFYPRPPRGGRRQRASPARHLRDFYPRPPRGGRRLCLSGAKPLHPISIHALREEGDSFLDFW